MKYFFSFLLFVILTPFLSMKAYSQDSPLSLEDLIPGGKTFQNYRPRQPRLLGWNDDHLLLAKGDSIWSVLPSNLKKKTLFFTKENLLKVTGISEKKAFGSFLNSFYCLSKDGYVAFKDVNGIIYWFDPKHKTLFSNYSVSSDMSDLSFSPDLANLAYTKQNNIYLLSHNGETVQITNETSSDVVCGKAVHRNEFGIDKGLFWSPQNDKLAFYRMDQSMVTDYPLVNTFVRPSALHNIKYPMAGMKSHQVKVGVYDLSSHRIVYLKTGLPRDKYLTNVAWSPDGKFIYIAELNRDQDTCRLQCYDALSGNLKKTLFTETDSAYVEPMHPIQFVPGHSDQFVWQSRRDGYNHFYLYNTDGQLLRQLTSGQWEVIDFLGFDPQGTHLYYVSNQGSPIDKQLYSCEVKSGKTLQLSKAVGVHAGVLSNSGRFLLDTYTSQYNPGTVDVVQTSNAKAKTYYVAANPFKNIVLPEITLGTIKAADGVTDLYYRLVKPLHFDSTKKYPTIVYVYGGPHSQLVDDSWMGQVRGWDIYMAEKGYVVFTLDNRGTSNRGMAFETVTHRRLGITETQDQMAGVAFLKHQPYVDSTRMGVHGWSFGGFMTLNLMLRHPETFKVAVAGGPVTDWRYYEIMYGERYMDTPKENPEGYKETSMVDKAANLKGRLLIIHGDQDNTVVPQNSFRFIEACIKAGTQPDFFMYPGQEHNMIGRDRIHLHQKISRYFDDFLK